MTHITTIIFDFGGTLAAVYPSQDWLYLKACREFGVEGDPERLRHADAGGWDDYMTPHGPAHPQISASRDMFVQFKNAVIVKRLQNSGVSGPLEAIAARICDLDTDPEMYRLYDDTIPTLDALKAAGYRMAVLSNHEWDLPGLVDGLGLGGYFEIVVTSARSGYRKPHPMAYQHAFDALNVDPSDAMMVGDDLVADIRASYDLGMQPVYIERDGMGKGKLSGGTLPEGVATIRTLTELPALL